MLELFFHFLKSFINSIAVIYVLMNLLDEKINLRNIKIYIVLLFFTCFSIISYFYINNLIKLAFMTLIVCLGNYYLFRKNIKITIISSFFEQIIVVFSEIILNAILLIFFLYDAQEIKNNLFCNSFIVISISLLMVLIIKINFTKKIYNIFLSVTDKIDIVSLLLQFILILILINVLIFISYLQISYDILFFINLIFILIYFGIFYYALCKSNENIQFKEKNKILISNLNEYEKMLDYQRINNHENKNQLLVIKSMIEKNNEKTIEYINEIIKEKREDNEIIYTKTKMIPSGGLQGLIYQKMLLMQDNNIETILEINKQVRKINLSNNSTKMNYDICRIIGIILDNAIEETIKFNKKEREIIIFMYVDDYFIIEISNRIKDDVDVNKIFEKGYTTKDKGHGYGLSLLNKIVNENEKIINDIRIVNDIFTQIVKIKM